MSANTALIAGYKRELFWGEIMMVNRGRERREMERV